MTNLLQDKLEASRAAVRERGEFPFSAEAKENAKVLAKELTSDYGIRTLRRVVIDVGASGGNVLPDDSRLKVAEFVDELHCALSDCMGKTVSRISYDELLLSSIDGTPPRHFDDDDVVIITEWYDWENETCPFVARAGVQRLLRRRYSKRRPVVLVRGADSRELNVVELRIGTKDGFVV